MEVSDFTAESYDNADMKPFLVPYLVEDQLAAKGNMIVIAGGGYSSRGNAMEGYPIAEAFQDLGYNAYVLQRRVAPYSQEDTWLDMQRAVRYLRYNADSLGLGGMDCIAAAASRAVRAPSWEKWPTCMAMFSPPCMMQIMPPTQWIR